MNIHKIVKIFAAVVSLIAVFLLVRIIMIGDEALESDVSKQGIIDFFVYFARYLLIAVAIVTVVLSIMNLLKHPKALKKTLIGVGVLLVLLAVTYFMASSEEVKDAFGEIVPIKNSKGIILSGDEAASVSKWVSALINFTGILGFLGILAIGSGFVKSLVKK